MSLQELPKIETEIENLALAWKENNDKEFMINGLNVTDYIKSEWDKYHNSKQLEKIVKVYKYKY